MEFLGSFVKTGSWGLELEFEHLQDAVPFSVVAQHPACPWDTLQAGAVLGVLHFHVEVMQCPSVH